jgi:hypothetical protein
MDGAAITGLSVGIPIAGLIIAIVNNTLKVGKWQGGVDNILKGHDKRLDDDEKKFNDAMLEQRVACRGRLESCGKEFEHLHSRINGIKDK